MAGSEGFECKPYEILGQGENLRTSGKKPIIKGRRYVNTASRQRIITVYSGFLEMSLGCSFFNYFFLESFQPGLGVCCKECILMGK